MLNFKSFGKVLVSMICLACVLLVNPVSALSTSSSLVSVDPGVVAPAPETSLENLITSPSGHLVSLVRQSSYTSANIIGCLENGTKITVLAKRGNFYKIDCYDMKGYILKSQVAVDEAGEYYVNCDEDSSESKYLGSYATQEAITLKSDLLQIAPEYLGVRYVWGGSSRWGFDCSGFTSFVFEKIGITLNRTALLQMQDGVIIAEEDLQPGDLVFYSGTSGRGFGSHVALYIGNGQIIHASTKRGVVIDDLHNPYMYKYYECSRRIILSDVAAAASIPTVNAITSNVGSGWRSGN